MTELPTTVDGIDYWPSIRAAVPESYAEAVTLWGPEVIACEQVEWNSRTTIGNIVWLLCRLHVRQLLAKVRKWQRSDTKQYMFLETVGDQFLINDHAAWLCPYKDYPSFLEGILDGVEGHIHISFTYMEMADEEFEEFCIEHDIDWSE